MKLVLDGERPLGWNALMRANKFAKNREAQRIYGLIRYELYNQYPDFTPFESQVFIVYRVYFKDRPLDYDNINDKTYTDGLVRAGLIADDNRKHVAGGARYNLISKDNPRVEIDIIRV